MKTSAFPEAEPFSGYEPIGIVQGDTPTTVQSTVAIVSGYRQQQPQVRLGRGAYADGFSSIAIGGGESFAVGSTSTMAIGYESFAPASLNVTVGTPNYSTGSYAVSIGGYSFMPGSPSNSTIVGSGGEGGSGANYTTALGVEINQNVSNTVSLGHSIDSSEGAGAVFIGGNFTTLVPESSVCIGSYNRSYGPWCVAIGGADTKTIFRGVSIGHRTGFASVEYASAGEGSIAIGANIYTPNGPAVGIGYDILAAFSSVVFGSCLASIESVAIGYSCDVGGNNAVGIGHSLSAASHSVALGSYNCNAYQSYTSLLGSATDSHVRGGFVNAGVPTNILFRPVVLQQKFIGATIAPKKATAAWGDGSYTATVTYDTAGAIGNNFTLAVTDNGADEGRAIGFDDPTLTIYLATNDPSTNTLVNISDLFPSDGFSFSYTDGFDDTVISFTFSENFANGVDGSPTAVLTTDGNSPSSTNVPATYTNSLATVTGTVVAAAPDLFAEGGDLANFTLAPVMVLQVFQTETNSYSFIGTPTFTLTSHAGGADWPYPTLTTSDDQTQLLITVTNIDADLNWMAHLTFEASQDATPP